MSVININQISDYLNKIFLLECQIEKICSKNVLSKFEEELYKKINSDIQEISDKLSHVIGGRNV